eukprot:scaffold192564_cov33-Prasinocladus_malaysianus.AAC.1
MASQLWSEMPPYSNPLLFLRLNYTIKWYNFEGYFDSQSTHLTYARYHLYTSGTYAMSGSE